jgi:hypothetical protein
MNENSKMSQAVMMAMYFHPIAVMAIELTFCEKKPLILPQTCSTAIPRAL